MSSLTLKDSSGETTPASYPPDSLSQGSPRMQPQQTRRHIYPLIRMMT
jgi:hypothetical protein